jgi:hypothetical protein
MRELPVTSANPLPDEDRPLPYKEITDQTYAVQAAQSFTVSEPARGTLILRGPCPRCCAVIDIPVISNIFRLSGLVSGLLPARGQSAEVNHTEPMMCTCIEDHPGRPAERDGCGAYWNLSISSTP